MARRGQARPGQVLTNALAYTDTHLEITPLTLTPSTGFAIFIHEKGRTVETFNDQMLPKTHPETLSKLSK